MARGKYKRKRERQAQRQILISNLGLSTRLQNLLESNGISNLADLMEKTDDELLSIKGIGSAALTEINKKKAVNSAISPANVGRLVLFKNYSASVWLQ